MRVIGLLTILFSFTLIYGGDTHNRKALSVKIVSDEFDKKVPEGKCKITGVVYYLGEAHQDAEVCSHKGQECVNTNKKGLFTLLVDTSEVYVYASIIGAQTSYLQNYKFQSQHHLDLVFYIEQKNTLVKKPVLYLYAEEETQLELKLTTDVELSFTYPQYEDGWDVTIHPSNGLSVEGENYPYLFWEGKDFGNLGYEVENDKMVGEVIQTDTVISYLKNATARYGLSATESADFITFWGPILSQKEYAFVQFILDENYNKVASLESSLPFDAERRLFMMYESYDLKPHLNVTSTQSSVEPFVRKGLTLIEWGGAEVSVPKL